MAAYFSCIMVNLFIFHVLLYSNSFFYFHFASFSIYLFTFVVFVIITVAALIYCYWFFVILHQFRIDHHHQLIERVRYLANKHAQTYIHCCFLHVPLIWIRAKQLKWNWIKSLRDRCGMRMLFVCFWLWQNGRFRRKCAVSMWKFVPKEWIWIWIL